ITIASMVIAVKPQTVEAVLPDYAPLAKNALVISVMAGKSLAKISEALGGAERLARAMPNLPAAIGKGVSGLYARQGVDAAGRALIEALMQAAGTVVWVRNEQEIDLVTAVSGSGPAYFFLLTEALADAGVQLGLKKETAAALARATLTGAGALLEADARSPAELRRAVTSPGGTTDAALKIFDGDDRALRSLVEKAAAAAAKRASELTD
ncbi:MAG: pyrroline-5-carboxylate reductase, partial [Pseudomonadota bacterium]